MAYKVFHRTWWKVNREGTWPNGLEPHIGKRKPIATVQTEEEARRLCKEWNAKHPPGKLSDKAEYEEC